MDECIKSNWSTRQLERQINSFYYERLLSTQESICFICLQKRN
ncbi:MAG: hypothetical protein AB6733_08165 [Clostridiaceae bacterium]